MAAAPANAQAVGCASYDMVIWGAHGVPYCFAGYGFTFVTVHGVTGVNMNKDGICYQFREQPGDIWTACKLGPDWGPLPGLTIDAEYEG